MCICMNALIHWRESNGAAPFQAPLSLSLSLSDPLGGDCLLLYT